MAIPKQDIVNSYHEILSLESDFKLLDENATQMIDMITQIWWMIVSHNFEYRLSEIGSMFITLFSSELLLIQQVYIRKKSYDFLLQF